MGLHLLRRSYFLPLMKKRRETVLYLPRSERAYRTLQPGARANPPPPLHKPLKIYPTISDLRRLPHLHLHIPGPRNPPVYIQSLPEHCLRLKKIFKKILLNKGAFKEYTIYRAHSLQKNPSGGPHPSQKKKKEKNKKKKVKKKKGKKNNRNRKRFYK